MSNVDVKQIRIGKRYSDALVASALDADVLQKVFDDLKFVESTIQSSIELKEFLEKPVISHNDKKDVIVQIFKDSISEMALNFLLLLVDNNRFNLFESAVVEYSNRLDEINNIVKVKVISAIELNDDMKNKLVQKLEQKISKKIVASYDLRPEIIAGLVIEINDKTVDTSLKTKLNNLKKQLI